MSDADTDRTTSTPPGSPVPESSPQAASEQRGDGFGRMLTRYGRIAPASIALAVVATSMVPAVIGFAIAGVGVAAVFPFVFSAAGRHGSSALAAVATLGYSGSLIGPPLFGFLAHGWGLQAALAALGVIALAMALSSRRAQWLQ